MPNPSPMSSPQANAVCPADEVFGVERVIDRFGRSSVLRPGPNTHGADGLPAPGLLFLSADMAIGGASVRAMGADEVIVTSSLHVEVHRRPFDSGHVVGAVDAEVHRYHGGSSGVARVVCDGATVATVSGRFAVLDLGTRGAGNIAADATLVAAADDERPASDWYQPHALIDSPVYRTLGTRVVESTANHLVLTFTAGPELANERRGIHGGIGALMGERAIDAVIRSLGRTGVDLRPITMSVAFLRPIPADHSTVLCTARIEHAGRRLVVAQAEVLTPDGKPAVVVDVVSGGVDIG